MNRLDKLERGRTRRRTLAMMAAASALVIGGMALLSGSDSVMSIWACARTDGLVRMGTARVSATQPVVKCPATSDVWVYWGVSQ